MKEFNVHIVLKDGSNLGFSIRTYSSATIQSIVADYKRTYANHKSVTVRLIS
jgi:hypothetical protein